MPFDTFSVVLLTLRADAPVHDGPAAAALQDAHMAYLADLKDAGSLLVAGPLLDPAQRGLSIFAAGVDETRALLEKDPAVVAGRFSFVVLPWIVPGGVIAFPEATLPRSMAEVNG